MLSGRYEIGDIVYGAVSITENEVSILKLTVVDVLESLKLGERLYDCEVKDDLSIRCMLPEDKLSNNFEDLVYIIEDLFKVEND